MTEEYDKKIMTEQNFSEDDADDAIEEKEDSSLLKGKEKEDPNRLCGLCGTQTKILLSGLAVVVLVAVGILIGATFSGKQQRAIIKSESSDIKQACKRGKIRLPENVVPIKYRIYLHPNVTNGKFDFSGNVKILIKIRNETDLIILHIKTLNILTTVVREATYRDLENSDGYPEIPIDESGGCERYEQLIIKLGNVVPAGSEYVLHIEFSATLSTILEGFYKSTYTTGKGEKRYLATTHFESTGARSAFPCFDEPALKANFTIIMVRERIHTVLSNMPLEKTVERHQDGLMVDHFEESVRMSTYLVAFVVSDFVSLHSTTPKGGVKVGVWAPAEQIKQAQFALESALKVLDYYDEFFKVKFPLPKLDMIAIPDFAAGAMENWGLITYRSTSLLYDPKESSASSKQWVATVVSHEFAHQWFGDLVTMKWWNDLWLNEGFAAFVEFIGTNLIDPSWRMMDQFLLDNVQKSLVQDSHLNSHPISVIVNDPAQINEIFDDISYDKGSSIIKMMQDFIGQDAFHEGLADYLNKYKYGNAESDDLWACMTKAQGGTLDVKEVMDTWILQMGYPVVNVVRDPNNKNIAIVTQKHFITDVQTDDNKPKASIYNYKWDVPLTYQFERENKERKWFYHDLDSITIPWKNTSKWLKVNVGQIGFYRVNYDKENWDALTKQLNDDHTVLDPADRANLLDDVFELARAGEMSTTRALDLTPYMKREKEYVPFISGFGSIGYIGGMLLERPGYDLYVKYIMQIILPRVQELGFTDTGSHLNKYLRSSVLHSAVYHNDTDSIEKAKTMFNDWRLQNKSIPANLRSTVYLAVLKYGGKEVWDFVFQKYKHSPIPSEKKKLMYALTWTSDPKILQHVLEMSLDDDIIKSQDSTSVINSVAGNLAGKKLALKFVKEHWDTLFTRYGHGSFDMSRLIKSVFGSARTQKGLDEAKAFLSTHELGSGKLAAKQTLAAIQNHIIWLKKNEDSVVKWLKKAVKE